MPELNPLTAAAEVSFEDPTNATGLGMPFLSRGVANARIGFLGGGGVLGVLTGGTAASILAQRQLNATALQATITKAPAFNKFYEIEGFEYQFYNATGMVLPLSNLDWHGQNGNQGTLLHQANPNAPILTIGDATGASASGGQHVSGFALDYLNPTAAVFTASVAATSSALVVTNIASGAIALGMTISSLTGSPTITAVPAGGGAGTYTLSATIATAVASTTMNGICLGANALVLGAAEDNYIEHGTVCLYYGSNPPNVAINVTATNNSAFWFQNELVDLEIGGWMQNGFNLGLQGTGSEVDNLYIHNGSGEGSEQPSSGPAINLQPPGQVSDFVFKRPNVEHVKLQNAIILQGIVNVRFEESHFEDIIFTDNGALINHVGGKLKMDETYCLDMGNTAGLTNPFFFYKSNYTQTVARIDGLTFKWSGYDGTAFLSAVNGGGPGMVLYNDSTGGGGDNIPQVTFTDLRFEDDNTGSANLTHVILDAVSHTEAIANGDQIAEYTPDKFFPRRRGYLATITAARTIYGGDEDFSGIIPATVPAAFQINLSNLRKAGKTTPTKIDTTISFRRQSGTYSGAVTFYDTLSATTIGTSSAAAGDFLFRFTASGYVATT